MSFATPAPTSLEAVRAEAAKVGQAGAVIQGRGNATEGNRYESFGIRTESLTTNEIQQLQSALVRSVGRSRSASATCPRASAGRS